MFHQLSRLCVSPLLLILLALTAAWLCREYAHDPAEFAQAIDNTGRYLSSLR